MNGSGTAWPHFPSSSGGSFTASRTDKCSAHNCHNIQTPRTSALTSDKPAVIFPKILAVYQVKHSLLLWAFQTRGRNSALGHFDRVIAIRVTDGGFLNAGMIRCFQGPCSIFSRGNGKRFAVCPAWTFGFEGIFLQSYPEIVSWCIKSRRTRREVMLAFWKKQFYLWGFHERGMSEYSPFMFIY